MAFEIPKNVGNILLQALALIPGLIDQAESSFSGKPGSGPAKKEFIMNSVKGLIAMQQTINPDLLTDAQEAAIILVVDKQTDATVEILNAIKLFQAPAV